MEVSSKTEKASVDYGKTQWSSPRRRKDAKAGRARKNSIQETMEKFRFKGRQKKLNKRTGQVNLLVANEWMLQDYTTENLVILHVMILQIQEK